MPKIKKDKTKNYKTLEERVAIANKIGEQLVENHIDGLVGMEEFHKILSEYVKPNLTCGFSGRLYVPELERHIEYILPVKKAALDMVRLVVSPHVQKVDLGK